MSTPDSDLPAVNVYRYEDLHDYHKRFVDEYLIDCMPGKAATRAGFDKGGASANLLMKVPRVASVIAQRLAERSHRLGITAEDVLRGLWEQYLRLLEMLQAHRSVITAEGGALLPATEWPDGWTRRCLFIEKQIADTSKLIGLHVNIKAFEADVVLENNNTFNLAVRYIGRDGTPRDPVPLATEASGTDRPPR